jgi:hypothetical protein
LKELLNSKAEEENISIYSDSGGAVEEDSQPKDDTIW